MMSKIDINRYIDVISLIVGAERRTDNRLLFRTL